MEETRKRMGRLPRDGQLGTLQVLLPVELISRLKDKADREQKDLSPWLRQRLIEIEKDGKI